MTSRASGPRVGRRREADPHRDDALESAQTCSLKVPTRVAPPRAPVLSQGWRSLTTHQPKRVPPVMLTREDDVDAHAVGRRPATA